MAQRSFLYLWHAIVTLLKPRSVLEQITYSFFSLLVDVPICSSGCEHFISMALRGFKFGALGIVILGYFIFSLLTLLYFLSLLSRVIRSRTFLEGFLKFTFMPFRDAYSMAVVLDRCLVGSLTVLPSVVLHDIRVLCGLFTLRLSVSLEETWKGIVTRL